MLLCFGMGSRGFIEDAVATVCTGGEDGLEDFSTELSEENKVTGWRLRRNGLDFVALCGSGGIWSGDKVSIGVNEFNVCDWLDPWALDVFHVVIFR